MRSVSGTPYSGTHAHTGLKRVIGLGGLLNIEKKLCDNAHVQITHKSSFKSFSIMQLYQLNNV